MAIIKLKSGSYQVKMRGSDGKWLTKCFRGKREADLFQSEAKREKFHGVGVTGTGRKITLDEYVQSWFGASLHQASPSWRKMQRKLYCRYISPIMGFQRLQCVSSRHISEVLGGMQTQGLSAQTQLHGFGLLRKVFNDAIELDRLLVFNPAIRKIRPKVPYKEAPHLNIKEISKLLLHVREKEYGVAIWLQFFLGLRVGELQALRWTDLDLYSGVVCIRTTYVRREKRFCDYPKGKRQYSKTIPKELRELLLQERAKATSQFVVVSSGHPMLAYEWYNVKLQRYCGEIGITVIGTHGLRHSTAELYQKFGASRDDIQRLFAHSCSSVTDKYMHGRGSNLEKVSNVIELFPNQMFQNVPFEGSLESSVGEEAKQTN